MKKFLFYTLLFGLATTSIFSILGYFGQNNWLLDLFSHFKFQYFLILSIGTLLLFFIKRKITLLFLPFIILLCWEISPLYSGSNKKTDLSETTKIVCINLLSSNRQFQNVEQFIEKNNPDIIVLQEFTKLWQRKLEPNLSAYKYRLTIPRIDNFGIAVYSKKRISSLQELQIGTAGVPSIVGDLSLGNLKVKLIATHPLPPVGPEYFKHRNAQLAELGSMVGKLESEIIIIGDLNTSSFSSHFKKLISNSKLMDTRKGFGQLTTWPTWLSLVHTTLDHCLVTEGILIKSRGVGKAIGSDHLPIFVELGLK